VIGFIVDIIGPV
jgi:H/ACA ribonucleoprotein complex non-core subunit NAF1